MKKYRIHTPPARLVAESAPVAHKLGTAASVSCHSVRNVRVGEGGWGEGGGREGGGGGATHETA